MKILNACSKKILLFPELKKQKCKQHIVIINTFTDYTKVVKMEEVEEKKQEELE